MFLAFRISVNAFLKLKIFFHLIYPSLMRPRNWQICDRCTKSLLFFSPNVIIAGCCCRAVHSDAPPGQSTQGCQPQEPTGVHELPQVQLQGSRDAQIFLLSGFVRQRTRGSSDTYCTPCSHFRVSHSMTNTNHFIDIQSWRVLGLCLKNRYTSYIAVPPGHVEIDEGLRCPPWENNFLLTNFILRF